MIVMCMSLLCVVISLLCDGVCLVMCLCYGLCLVFDYRCHWFVLCVRLCSSCVFLRLVCMICLWRVVLLFVVSLGLSCVCGVLVLLFCLRVCLFCYGLNAFPVYDCILYVPSWRCAFLFV